MLGIILNDCHGLFIRGQSLIFFGVLQLGVTQGVISVSQLKMVRPQELFLVGQG